MVAEPLPPTKLMTPTQLALGRRSRVVPEFNSIRVFFPESDLALTTAPSASGEAH